MSAANPMSGDLELAGRISDIRERLEAATPGPWQTRFLHRIFARVREVPGDLMFGTKPEQDWADCTLMANAPSDIRWLLARLEGLQNTAPDDAALREILAEAWEASLTKPDVSHPYLLSCVRSGDILEVPFAIVIDAMRRVSRLEGLRDVVTITDEMVERALDGWFCSRGDETDNPLWRDSPLHWADKWRGEMRNALTAALKSTDTETREAPKPQFAGGPK